MSGADRRRNQIREQLVSNSGKRVILVEGPDDSHAYEYLLGLAHGTSWSSEKGWVLAEAGGKRPLQEILELEPTWRGIVDRDEWDQAARDQATTRYPGLYILPRFCLESYLIVPAELWHTLGANQRERMDNDIGQIREPILSSLPDWLRHGVLWQVVTPLRDGLRAQGFVAQAQQIATARDDAAIRQLFDGWQAFLNPGRLMAEFRSRLTEAQADSPEDQLRHRIHGKRFFEQVVCPCLNERFGQTATRDYRNNLLRAMTAVPVDLRPLLDALVAP